MGKIVKPVKNSAKTGTKVKKEHSAKRSCHRIGREFSRKRIKLLHRRLSLLLDDKESLVAKNQELVDNYNKEKQLNAELQNQVFNWQRLYHEASISLNTYKVKYNDTMQTISSSVKEINVSFPHLVELTESVCRNKARLNALLNASRIFEAENYPTRAFMDGGQLNNDVSKKREKRMRQKVGPMVKGVLIQKPTIRLERVMLQQPPEQEPANSHHSPIGANDLTPIVEENEQESVHLGQISMKRRKLRLGSGERWRKKKQEQREKERQMEREQNKRESQCSSVAEESSDSDNQFEPIIRLPRVSGLLLSQNLMEVDRGRASEGKKATSRSSEPDTRRLRASEDPMEGCSWMNSNPPHSSNINRTKPDKEKQPSPASSDSSGDESVIINVVNKSVCNDVKDSLYKSQSFNAGRKTSSSSLSADTSQGASDCFRPEPDSTSNVVFVSLGSSAKTSLDTTSVSNSSLSAPKESAGSDTSIVIANQSQEVEDTLTLVTTPVQEPRNSVRPSLAKQKRSSSLCTPSESPVIQEKRIRRPKVHLYPGEEKDNPNTAVSKVKQVKPRVKNTSKVPISRLSAGRKSLTKSSLKRSSDVNRAFSATSSASGEDRHISQDGPTGSSQKKKIPRKSSIKKSIEPSRNSTTCNEQRVSQGQVSGDSDKRGSRRNKVKISYKESPLNVKMRRPK